MPCADLHVPIGNRGEGYLPHRDGDFERGELESLSKGPSPVEQLLVLYLLIELG